MPWGMPCVKVTSRDLRDSRCIQPDRTFCVRRPASFCSCGKLHTKTLAWFNSTWDNERTKRRCRRGRIDGERACYEARYFASYATCRKRRLHSRKKVPHSNKPSTSRIQIGRAARFRRSRTSRASILPRVLDPGPPPCSSGHCARHAAAYRQVSCAPGVAFYFRVARLTTAVERTGSVHGAPTGMHLG